MFHKQDFGRLAVGLSNVDELRKSHVNFLNEEPHESDRERFYTVTAGGVHHPWEHKEYETRVAITGDGMIFDEVCIGEEVVRIFAKVESIRGEVYFAYVHPWQVISVGFSDPIKVANELIELAADYNQKGIKEYVDRNWVVIDKRQVPVYHRSLLGKVMARVNDAFTQDHKFFRDPKSR